MPRKMEEALKRSAKKHGFEEGSDRYNRYVYGTLARYEKEHGDGGDRDGRDDSRDHDRVHD